MEKPTLETWLQQVDQLVQRFVGISVYDLADPPYRCWYEDGMSPRAAARAWIRFDQGIG